MLNSIAHQKLSTMNPFTHELAIMMMMALMTNKNKPNVITVNGIVRITITGLRKTFRKLITSATSKAVQKVVTWIPGNRYPAIRMATEVNNSLGMNDISGFVSDDFYDKGKECI
ncbi:MAG: hypothetical protein Q8M08_13305 [Bacteroidales bacterium]|nr:hypothetical protein [Bacteroidales bacterium]